MGPGIIRSLIAVIGFVIIAIVLWDGFETIVSPRRVTRKMRLTRLFYRYTWRIWSATVYAISSNKRNETYLSFYGPLSLLFLLSIWAAGLVLGFGLLHWAFGSSFSTAGLPAVLGEDMYLSGTNFFTLGLGDVVPRSIVGRLLTVVEAGLGFGFLALVIGYLPALNQSFSNREVIISMLDARAGSPPTATEVLRRHGYDNGPEDLRQLLSVWERWSAELLESHLSYPVLAYFRSQHDNQSWLSTLATILDTSCLVMAGLRGVCSHQAELTFAMARHAIVDLSIIFSTPPSGPDREDRLPAAELKHLRAILAETRLSFAEGTPVDHKLTELRHMYEPYLYSLADHLCLSIPPWIPGVTFRDNWETSAWGRVAAGTKKVVRQDYRHRHF